MPEFDVVIAAIKGGNPQELRELLRSTALGCTWADGLGGPPNGQEDEAEGTLIDVFPFLGPEGHTN